MNGRCETYYDLLCRHERYVWRISDVTSAARGSSYCYLVDCLNHIIEYINIKDISQDVMERRRYRIKVPHGIHSKKNDIVSPVCFKNLTDDNVSLYWVDFNGRANLYAELEPIQRSGKGFCVKTFATHPWVAVQRGKIQMLMNGKRYFFPPDPSVWKTQINGNLNKQWILENNTEDDEVQQQNKSVDNADEKYFEVLILTAGCITLRELCLRQSCQLYKTKQSFNELPIPNTLKLQLELTKAKLFINGNSSV